ncbi:MAG: CHAT domain-containing protein [Cyanomargarita calcarea GSE-NOS-MK-12-04C]|uniref:CHAT domain-containing protein n=1 Tax=Cyanomargarita calcarea GSE-NOS-MK-12-04C TaxID=2839659 RepID=A0A951QUP0_9CYAN|nr:CHAT domain-containing protein [Cyanomargarita calcarea GSE-NOS-MK-12-04C]
MWTSRAVALFFSLLLLSESTVASVGGYGLKIAEQPATNPSVPLSPDKQQLYQEGVKLYKEAQELQKKGTKEAYQQALGKYQQVLKIVQELGLRQEEALIYISIGTAYAIRSENLEAIEYFNKSLNISREVKQPLLEVLALTGIAGSYNFIGKGREALTLLKQAESISRTEKRFDILAIVLRNITNTYIELSEIPKTIEPLNQSLQIYRDILKDLPQQGKVLNTIGNSYSSMGQPKIALKYYQQALEIQQRRQDLLTDQAETLTDIGTLYNKSGEYNKALEYLNKAREIQQKQGLLVAEGLTIQSIAEVYKTRGDYQKSIEIRQQARVLLKKSGNTALEAINMTLTANIYKNFLGDNQKALEFVNEAIQLSKNIGYELTHANALNEKADIYALQGDLQKALEISSQALEIAISIKNRNLEARTLTNIASTYKLLGNYDLSIQTYKKARQIYQQAQDKQYELIILFAMSELYLTKGDYSEAINYYNQSVSLSRKQENNEFERLGLQGLARSYELQKDFTNALKNAETVLALSQKFEDKYSEASALNLIGIINQTKGNYKEALNYQQKALSLYRKIFVPKLEAQSLNNISVTHSLQKQHQQAIDTLNEELKIRRTLKDIQGEADALYSIAINQRKLGNLEAALPNIEEAIKIVENIRSNVKSQDLRTSYFATVQSYYKFKINLLMELHKKDPSKGYNAQALETSDRSRARGLVELLTEAGANIRKGANPELLAEESRLQALIDGKEKVRFEIVNSDKVKDPIFKANGEKLQTEIDELLNQQKQLETKIRQSSPKYANLKYPKPLTLPQIQQQLDKDTLLLQYSLGEDRSFLWVVSPTSLDTYELPKKSEIEKSAINLFCLISQNSSKPPSVTNKENPCADIKTPRIDKAAEELSKLVLAPVKGKLGKKRLVIVADGALQYIPFAAVADLTAQTPPQQVKEDKNQLENNPKDDRGIIVTPAIPASGKNFNYQPLFVNHEIVNLPSASAIAIQRQELSTRSSAGKKALAILADPVYTATDERLNSAGNKQLNKQDSLGIELERSALKRSADIVNRQGWTRLLGTRIEAETILKLVPDSDRLQVFDFAANYTWATSSALNQFRILHFATHGFVNDANPELSGIVLSLVDKQGKDIRGYLRLGDLFNLDYPADLIVLSACETGLGKEIQGEGLVGLTRGLMYAGAERLVVSLWQVDDKGTAVFMQEFYKQMLIEGKPANEALRATQLKMWKQEKWRNPNYWAAFTFLGEWR